MPIAQLLQNLHDHIALNRGVDFAEAIIPSVDISQLWVISFDETGMQLKQILESTYTDGITGLEEVENDGEKITGIFLDKISPSVTKRYRFTITPDKISYQLENPDDIDNADFAELEFAAKKQKNCTKGTACGNTCIAAGRQCNQKPSPQTQQAIKQVVSKAPTTSTPNTAVTQKQTAAKAPTTSAPNTAVTQNNLLKASKINPYANPDMTPDEFNKFREDRDFIDFHKSPDFIGNQTYDQWKGDNSKSTHSLSRYKSEVLAAIRNGYAISDSRLSSAGVKLNKQQQSQLTNNRQNFDDLEASTSSIQKAIDHPLVDAQTAKKYKPKMTEDEANEYTKDSYTGNLSFYHGNTVDVTGDVENSGAKPEKNTRGIFGQGFYLAATSRESQQYAYTSGKDKNQQSSVIATKVNVKNPYISDSADLGKLGGNFPGDQSNNIDSKALTEYIRAKGYDSIYLKDFGYFVALDGKQVVTYKNETLSKTQSEEIEKAINQGKETETENIKRTANSEVGKTLGKATKSKF